MKRLISLLICLVMIMSMMAFTVTAEEATEDTSGTLVTSVSVTGTVPTIAVGDALPEPDFAVTGDASCFVEYAYWQVTDGVNFTSAEPGDIVAEGHRYTLMVMIRPNEGYTLAENPVIYVNGETGAEMGFGDNLWLFGYEYSFMPEIDSIELTMADPVIGEVPGVASVPGDANYTVSTSWDDMDTGMPLEGVIEDNHNYAASFLIQPAVGYQFSVDAVVTLNGEPAEWYGVSASGASASKVYSFAKIAVTPDIYFELPSAGTAASADVTIFWPEAYTLAGAYWTENDSADPFTGTFTAGNTYTLHAVVTANEGFQFTENLAYVNGAEYGNVSVDGNTMEITYAIKLLPSLPTANVSGAVAPALGQQLTIPALTASDGIQIVNAYWARTSGNSGDGPYDGVVEEGYIYELHVQITCTDEDYVLDYNTELSMDGQVFTFYQVDYNVMEVYTSYSFMDQIPAAGVSGVPASIAVGDPVTVPTITADGSDYDVSYVGWMEVSNGSYVPVESAVFEDGKVYMLYVGLYAYGYEFGEDTVISTNGAAGGYSSVVYYGNSCGLYYSYALGLKEIQQIDLSIQPPVAGVKADPSAIVTTSEGCSVVDPVWDAANADDLSDLQEFTGTFGSHKYYFASVAVIPADGYYIGDGVKIYVNGVDVTDDCYIGDNYVSVWHAFDTACQHAYFNECDANCYICGEYREASHAYDNDCDVDCNICSTARTVDSHVYDDEFDGLCNTCGFKRDVESQIAVENGLAIVNSAAVDAAISSAGETGTAVIEVEEASSTQLPVTSLTDVAEAEAELTVSMAEATVTIDAATLAAVAQQAGDETVTLEVTQIEAGTLNEAQLAAVADQEIAMTISAQFISGEDTIHDFNGGTVTIAVPFVPAAGTAGEDYVVLFLADDGSTETIETAYVDGQLVFTLEHFSKYVVVNTSNSKNTDEPTQPVETEALAPTETEEAEAPASTAEQESNGGFGWIVIVVLVVAAAGIYFAKKRKG